MRLPMLLALAALPALSSPLSAQIFWQGPDFTGAPLQPGEPGMGVMLPGATVAEERANWAWQMRAGLNVAKLQCKFDKTLLAADSYDGVYINHAAELAQAYDTLRKYFIRTTKTARAAQQALDQYGTKTYSGFSTVSNQYGFCHNASKIGKKALFAPRGAFTIFVVENLRELRNALNVGGEQYFRKPRLLYNFPMPQLDEKCWKRNVYVEKCGVVYL